MKVFKQSIFLLVIGLLTACSSQETQTFWVNSLKSPCDAGAGKIQCLLISANDTLEKASWSYFYNTIEGFEFKPGVFQKIEVSVTTIDKVEVPADGSSLKYSLLNVLEEMKDERLGLNDLWVVQKLNRQDVTNQPDLPQLEIHISKMQIMGTDGCNNYNGKIEELTSTKITFGALASTRKMCPNMDLVNQYNGALAKTANYKKEGLKLFFFDENGNETVVFKKID